MKPVAVINNPCHESWERMNPDEKGRHCDQCCKVVVDFTGMSNDAIAGYLQQRTQEKVCGRFKAEQVAQFPSKRIRFSFQVQRFAAAVLLAFGSFLFASCSSLKPGDPDIMGDVAYIPDTTVKHQVNTSRHITGDTVATVHPEGPEPYIMGEVMMPECTIDPDPDVE
jgi:hypothetical protein